MKWFLIMFCYSVYKSNLNNIFIFVNKKIFKLKMFFLNICWLFFWNKESIDVVVKGYD